MCALYVRPICRALYVHNSLISTVSGRPQSPGAKGSDRRINPCRRCGRSNVFEIYTCIIPKLNFKKSLIGLTGLIKCRCYLVSLVLGRGRRGGRGGQEWMTGISGAEFSLRPGTMALRSQGPTLRVSECIGTQRDSIPQSLGCLHTATPLLHNDKGPPSSQHLRIIGRVVHDSHILQPTDRSLPQIPFALNLMKETITDIHRCWGHLLWHYKNQAHFS